LLATNKSPEDVASTVGFSELPTTALIDKTTKSTRYGCGIADSSLYLGCKLFDSLRYSAGRNARRLKLKQFTTPFRQTGTFSTALLLVFASEVADSNGAESCSQRKCALAGRGARYERKHATRYTESNRAAAMATPGAEHSMNPPHTESFGLRPPWYSHRPRP